MSKPLLEKLSLKEATAIFAHELAHIEDFSEDWLKRSRLADIFMVMVGFVIFPALSALSGESFEWMPWVWFGLLVAIYISKVRGMQNREVFADTRGLELSRDLDAFITGLTVLYAHARIPRRVQFEVDQQASHPSLARRIQENKIVILGNRSLYLLNLGSNSGVKIPLSESTTWEVEASLRGKRIAMMWRDGSRVKIECLTLNEASLPEGYLLASHFSE